MEVSRYKGVDAFPGGPKAHLLDALECVSKPLIRRKRRSLPRACGGSEGKRGSVKMDRPIRCATGVSLAW